MKSTRTLGILVGGTLFALAALIYVQWSGIQVPLMGSLGGTMTPPPPPAASPQEVPESIVMVLDESTFIEDGGDGEPVVSGGFNAGSCRTVTRKVRINQTQTVSTKNGEAAAKAQAKAVSDAKVEISCASADSAPQCQKGCTGVPGSARIQYKSLTTATVINTLPVPNTTSVVYVIKTTGGGCDLLRDCK